MNKWNRCINDAVELGRSKCILGPMNTSTRHRIYEQSNMNQHSNSKHVTYIKWKDHDGRDWRLQWRSWMIGFALYFWALYWTKWLSIQWMLGHLCVDLWKGNWMVYEAWCTYVLNIGLCRDTFVSRVYAKFEMVNTYEWFRMEWIQWSVARICSRFLFEMEVKM